MSNKARATDEWDLSDASEKVDWYFEYIARHAQLSARWFSPQNAKSQDIRGAALFEDGDGKRLVGPLEDGSLGLWNLDRVDGGAFRHLQISHKPARSPSGVLFNDSTTVTESSQSDAKKALAFSGVADCISIDGARQRAYVAVGDLLSEVDLDNLKVVSQTRYAWSITALSQIQCPHQPLTVGTSFSLHILDPRIHPRGRSSSPGGKADLEESVAFFPNKDLSRNVDPARRSRIHPFSGFGTDSPLQPYNPIPTSSILGRSSLSSYAQVEPAPLSILHQTDHSIMVAGRFPSILNYDRRYFPRLECVIHSSARLSALAYLPFSPRGVKQSASPESRGTLISCGEYNGRGSLELYSVPHHPASSPSDEAFNNPSSLSDPVEAGTTAATDLSGSSNSGSGNTQNPTPAGISSYKNRQTISSAKLLSVATQGTRIVFSDADGGLKWVERDGRSIARRWNINSYQLHQESFPRSGRNGNVGSGSGQPQRFEAAIHGEEVVRKIIPTGMGAADDLLVWTGERAGLVRLGGEESELWDALEERAGNVVKTLDGLVDAHSRRAGDGANLHEAAQEYDRQMRRALERQTDELNWMHRFGFRGN